ncbi:MAG: hypothetical protein ACOY33_04285 [Pseudomonadota bacterium]
MTEPGLDPKQLDGQRLGHGDEVLRTRTLAELIAVTDHMTAQAMNNLRILAPDTEPELYGRDDFGALVSDLIARRARVARIRLLIADPSRARHQSHKLIELWHRFPSFIDVRELRDVYAENREAFLLVDDTGLIRREEKTEWPAVVTYRNPATGSSRAGWFDEAWEHAAPCSALRRLGI